MTSDVRLVDKYRVQRPAQGANDVCSYLGSLTDLQRSARKIHRRLRRAIASICSHSGAVSLWREGDGQGGLERKCPAER